MKVALDTNVLVYAEGVDDPARERKAVELIRRHASDGIVVPAQVLLELVSVLRRKTAASAQEVQVRLVRWIDNYEIVDSDPAIVLAALDLSVAHRVGWWDAVVLASAAVADCRTLYSEDMQDGFIWRGVTVRNPFAA